MVGVGVELPHDLSNAPMSLLPCITWRISTSFFSTRIDDHLLAYRKTTQTWTQIFVPSATGVGMPGKHEKTLSNRINESVRNLDAAAFSRGVVPDIVKFGSGLGCNAMRHQREEVCSEATRVRPRCFTSWANCRMDS